MGSAEGLLAPPRARDQILWDEEGTELSFPVVLPTTRQTSSCTLGWAALPLPAGMY